MPTIRKVVMETLYGQHAGNEVDVSDLSNVVVTYLGTWVGTVAVQISQDGVYWTTPTNMTPANAIGHYDVPVGVRFVRVNCTAYTSGAIQASLTGEEMQLPKKYGSLGDLVDGTPGSAVYVGDLKDICVQIAGRDVGTFTYTAACCIEVSQDGTNWAPGSGVSTLTNTSGTYLVLGRVQYIRAHCTAYTQGIASVRYCGTHYDQVPGSSYTEKGRFGTLGDVDSALAEAAKDIGDLDDVAVTLTFSLGANMTVSLESLLGTFWVPVPGATGFAAGTDVTFVMPGPVKQLRANPTAWVGGTCAVRFGGVDDTLTK